jgi:hypothetical protein
MTDQPPTAETVSLEGRTFHDVTPDRAGDVDGETIFQYHESSDGTVWASYGGGGVRLGFLVGTRRGLALDFRYAHLTDRGETATGRCTSRIEHLDDGRLRMNEIWSWESRPGSGESVVEEIPSAPPLDGAPDIPPT